MRVFVTGATGFIGSAIVKKLVEAGHQVLGLARSDDAVDALTGLGVEAHRGDLRDLESLAAGAKLCQGVVHTAFIHDFSTMASNLETDKLAVQTLGEALAGSDPALVVAFVTLALTPNRLATEEDAPDPSAFGGPRIPSEQAALAAASRGVRASVVRLPPSVHGDGEHGMVAGLISIARQKGVSAYVGDGSNRWPAVHRLDAAHLFRLALEEGSPGSRYHAVAEEGVPFRDIAEVIGRRLKLPVVAKSSEEAAEHFGFMGYFVGMDAPVSSAKTQEWLRWSPSQHGLIADLDRESYFQA